MGLFEMHRHPDINRGVEEYQRSADAVLLDVRTPQEYRQGHIPGSINLPLQAIDNVYEVVENEDAVLYVYCRSGTRSGQAVSILQHMGFVNATNIGGMAAYTGKVET